MTTTTPTTIIIITRITRITIITTYSLNEDLDPLLITEPQQWLRNIMHDIWKLLHFTLLHYAVEKVLRTFCVENFITFCDSITICGLTVGSKFSPENLIEWISHLLTALDLRKTSSLSIRSVMFRKVCSISTILLPFDNIC